MESAKPGQGGTRFTRPESFPGCPALGGKLIPGFQKGYTKEEIEQSRISEKDKWDKKGMTSLAERGSLPEWHISKS